MRFISMIRIEENSGQVPSDHGDDWDIECEVRQLDGPEFGSQS